MEAIGVAASILSLIKATKTIRSWINHVVHVNENICDLYSEPQSFEFLV